MSPHEQTDSLAQLPQKSRVGIVGVPPRAVMIHLRQRQAQIFDLDEPLVKKNMEETMGYLPRVYCAILRTVLLNALHLELDAIVMDIGPGKCDCALHLATVLSHHLAPPVISCRNLDEEDFGTPWCRAELGLPEKMAKITTSIQNPEVTNDPPRPCLPTAGFWGVPPRDFSLLKNFPATTHVYGWARCMENKTPYNLTLEQQFNPKIPTVFFAQSFCAKTALAKHLAALHPRGLFVDADVSGSSSIRAKIEAFLELSGVPLAAG
ncbi:MAG: hypothetical protein ABFR97_00445 [Thermodesulfobacteriota bacterium]